MLLISRLLQSWYRKYRRSRSRKSPRLFWSSSFERLEQRWLPSAFTVIDTSDNAADTGSLRDAIDNLATGSAANTNTINFNLPAGSTIDLSHGVLAISQGVTINGPARANSASAATTRAACSRSIPAAPDRSSRCRE